MNAGERPGEWMHITFREVLYLGFCATFIVLARVFLRFKLNVPGHAMFFTIFFMMLGRGCVRKLGAATLTGVVAGMISMLFGLGKGGPLLVINFLCPGLVIDLGGLVYPRLFSSYWGCLIVGALAAATRFGTIFLVEGLLGMEKGMIAAHAVLSTGLGMVFGSLGALMVPVIIRRLQAHRLI